MRASHLAFLTFLSVWTAANSVEAAQKIAAPPIGGTATTTKAFLSPIQDAYFAELARLIPDRAIRKIGLDVVAVGQALHPQSCPKTNPSCFCPVKETGCWIDLGVASVVDQLIVSKITSEEQHAFTLVLASFQNLQSERSTVQVHKVTERIALDSLSYDLRRALTQLLAPEQYRGSLSVQGPEGIWVLVDGKGVPDSSSVTLPVGSHEVEIRQDGVAKIIPVEIAFEQTRTLKIPAKTLPKADLYPMTLAGISLVAAGGIVGAASLGTLGLVALSGTSGSVANYEKTSPQVGLWRGGLVGVGLSTVLLAVGGTTWFVAQGAGE